VSYPPGPPNNPYGNQPPQQPSQQPYGYPQQQAPQPGYGYPQQPQSGYAAYPQQAGYGYPHAGMPMQMPGMVKTGRVLLFVFSGLQVLGGIGSLIGGAAVSSSDEMYSGLAGGVLVFTGIVLLAFAAWGIFLGVKFSTGGQGIRITTIVYASLLILFSLLNVANGAAGVLPAIIGLGISGTLLASVVQSQAAAWFNRPKY
jgi:hypothetical protein